MEIEAPAFRRRPSFRTERMLLAIAQVSCVLIVLSWVTFLVYLTLLLL